MLTTRLTSGVLAAMAAVVLSACASRSTVSGALAPPDKQIYRANDVTGGS